MSTTVQQIRRRVTIDEFRALPEGPPYFEFEQGELIPMASPNRRHQEILLNLSFGRRAQPGVRPGERYFSRRPCRAWRSTREPCWRRSPPFVFNSL